MLLGLFPHPTAVVHLTLTGAQILSVLEQSATNLHPADDLDGVGGLVQTAGMRWTIDLTRLIGHRIRDVFVGPTPLDRGRRYAVVTNGGLLQGTHRYSAFAEGRDIVRDARSFAVVLEEALRAHGTIHAPPLGAVTMRR